MRATRLPTLMRAVKVKALRELRNKRRVMSGLKLIKKEGVMRSMKLIKEERVMRGLRMKRVTMRVVMMRCRLGVQSMKG